MVLRPSHLAVGPPRRVMATRRTSVLDDPQEVFVTLLAGAAEGRLNLQSRQEGSTNHWMAPARVGIGDDAAVLADGTLVTTDTMVEGVHFDERLSPEDVGYKLVAVNVSDIDAMGGRPTWATLALSLPRDFQPERLAAFYLGLEQGLSKFRCLLVGGDTTRANGGMVATLTVGGRSGEPVTRRRAAPEHDVWVSGRLGLAAEAMLDAHPRPEAILHLRRPYIPAPLGAVLAETGLVSAMMDLSDGLARDLGRLALASGCGACIDPARLPTDRPLAQAVAYGEDYGLLFTAPPAHRSRIQSTATSLSQTVTRIGALTESVALTLVGHASWPDALFDHFGETSVHPAPDSTGRPRVTNAENTG